mmetsp:Transcript_66651/g.124427  ORF Transcript_66651/g.124427 Transcript_66651/m.124427 type:complete len:212 (+) Transcript_66651:1399-2034(+)
MVDTAMHLDNYFWVQQCQQIQGLPSCSKSCQCLLSAHQRWLRGLWHLLRLPRRLVVMCSRLSSPQLPLVTPLAILWKTPLYRPCEARVPQELYGECGPFLPGTAATALPMIRVQSQRQYATLCSAPLSSRQLQPRGKRGRHQLQPHPDGDPYQPSMLTWRRHEHLRHRHSLHRQHPTSLVAGTSTARLMQAPVASPWALWASSTPLQERHR